MKNVLIIGSTGQIGSELTMKLRSIYNGNIVAGYIPVSYTHLIQVANFSIATTFVVEYTFVIPSVFVAVSYTHLDVYKRQAMTKIEETARNLSYIGI